MQRKAKPREVVCIRCFKGFEAYSSRARKDDEHYKENDLG